MESNFKSSKTEFGYKPLDIFNDSVTKSKIYRHLIDINDTITEEDIRNIKVSISDNGPVSFTQNDDENTKHRSITPWDVLDIEA